MTMDMPFKNINESNIEIVNNEIEVLDDFESINNETKKEEPKEEEFIPFFFETKTNSNENTIEEIKPLKEQENVIDPMDSVIKLSPNYNQLIEEAVGLDLKTAINEIRELVTRLEQKGFKLSLDELDLDNNYQMTINIKNNDEN